MKSVVLIIFALGFVCSGPIDDGLLDQRPRRVNPDEVDAVVVDMGDETPRTYRRRPYFRPPYFYQDDSSDDEDESFGPFLGAVRPFGYGQSFSPYGSPYGPAGYGGDFFTRLRHQMEMFRRYMSGIWNVNSHFDPQLPPNYDNSTYTTKVVNGSVISVNETIKKHTTNDSSFVFSFKVVKIRPENETISTNSDNDKEPEQPSFGAWPVPERRPENETASPASATEDSATPMATTDNEFNNNVF